jgi:hypothetical protein
MNIKKANKIINQINDVVSKWAIFAEEAKVKIDFMELISKSHLFL